MILRQNPDIPTTGHAFPQSDAAAVNRATAALDAYGTIDVDNPQQAAILSRIDVLRRRHVGRRGSPMAGLRLSQLSQAGKSHVLKRYIRELKDRTMLETGTVNPFQVLYLGLEVRITVKMMCVELLRQMGDPYYNVGNADEVKLRTREFMERRGVELAMIDEVQHLSTQTHQKVDVTDELKRFLDDGIVPIVFAGNEDSQPFFERNTQLASRLGAPLELSAVDTSQESQLIAFDRFCQGLDAAMVAASCVRRPSGFRDTLIVDVLLRASGGLIGRVCRIVEAALEHAALRDADFVEAYDLSYAIDSFAIGQGYTNANPFPTTIRELRRRAPKIDADDGIL